MNNPDPILPKTLRSPFGSEAMLLQTVPVDFIVEQYKRKCGIDVSLQFGTLKRIGLYVCVETGYRFWRPEEIAGDESFYGSISSAWKNYYRKERWEYPHVRKFLTGKEKLLEIGCGKGYFLQSIESQVKIPTGLELNKEAIRNKVTSAEILHAPIEEMAAQENKFDVACAFHVLEHVVDPRHFIQNALACLTNDGTLILSTPNNDNIIFRNQQDIFDTPPHHMGHFTAATYEKIAMRLGCTISKIVIQPRKVALPDTAKDISHSAFRRATNLISRLLVTLNYRLNSEPGETILVFLKKLNIP